MKVGAVVPIGDGDGGTPGAPSWREIRGFAQRAEELGFDSVWAPDHLLPHLDAVGGPGAIHEAWTLVSALAASTSRIDIGTLVIAAPWRNPALLAKMAVTLDEVSDGRLILGLGTGYHEPEFAAFGYGRADDHPVTRLEQALRIIVPLLRDERVTFEGRYASARDVVLLPAPKRRIPVLIAGEGPRMIRLATQWSDLWNTAWYEHPDERLTARLASLDDALAAEARARDSLVVSVGTRVGEEDSDEIAAAMREFADAGADQLIVRIEPPRTERSLERVARALAVYRAAQEERASNGRAG